MPFSPSKGFFMNMKICVPSPYPNHVSQSTFREMITSPPIHRDLFVKINDQTASTIIRSEKI